MFIVHDFFKPFFFFHNHKALKLLICGTGARWLNESCDPESSTNARTHVHTFITTAAVTIALLCCDQIQTQSTAPTRPTQTWTTHEASASKHPAPLRSPPPSATVPLLMRSHFTPPYLPPSHTLKVEITPLTRSLSLFSCDPHHHTDTQWDYSQPHFASGQTYAAPPCPPRFHSGCVCLLCACERELF